MAELGIHDSDDQEIEARAAREMTRIARGYLTILCIALAVFFARRAFQYFYTFPEPNSYLLGSVALISDVFVLGVLAWRFLGHIPDRLVEPLLIAIGLFMTVNVFWNLYLTRNPDQLVAASYAMIVFGLTALSLRAWLLVMLPSTICFLVGMVYLGVGDFLRVILPLAGGGGLSCVAYFTRVPVLRTRLRLEARLARETERLRAASEAKDRFLANMTHELRTPMTGVLGMLDLAADTKLDGEQRDLISTAQSSARYMLAVINDILDVSKLEAGKIDLNPEAADPVRLTEDVVALFRGQAEAKGLTVTTDLPTAEGQLVASIDPVRVAQVLLNLVSNAVKYTVRGQVVVRLRYEDDAGRATLCWEVCDTGTGIPADRIDNLFERFEQLDSSPVRQQGTGLGLAIIRELVALMAGEISVESQVGVGSTFRVRLPLVAAKGPPLRRASHSAQASLLPPTLVGRNLRVLVAEDNPVNQKLIQKMLAREGWDVTLVENGEAAVSAACEGASTFDIVLMDVQMPVMDGLTATRLLIERLEMPPPVVALTANTMDRDLEAYRAAGMHGVVGKPIDRATLYQAIASALVAAARDRAAAGHGFA